MESLFHSLDCKYNPTSSFWQKIPNDLQEDLFANAIFSGTLLISHTNQSLKPKKFILTKSAIYQLSKWKIPKYKSNINWKLVEAFQEQQTDSCRYGFRLIGNAFEDFYVPNPHELNNWLEKLSQVSIFTSLEEDFITIKEINKGASATVTLCKSTDDSLEYAVKTVYKSLFAQEPITFENIVNEISVLRVTCHPNIVKMFKVYETEDGVHLVLEYLSGGDACRRLNKIKRFSERDALRFVLTVLSALEYLHGLDIVHRDIKLENLAFCDESCEEFKVIDFGLACKVNGRLTGACGTAGFIAPEILREASYSSKVDIFSTGVILYILLTGKMLFSGKTRNEILMKNKECKIKTVISKLRNVKKETKRLIECMLNTETYLRCSASEALEKLCTKELCGREFVYKVQETGEGFYFDKGNTTDSVNKSQFLRSAPMINNYVHPL